MAGSSGIGPSPFRPDEIAPLAYMGQNLLLRRNNKFTIFKVHELEPILPSHGIVRDFGALTTGQVLSSQSLQAQMEMDKGLESAGFNGDEIGQFRVRVLDDIRLTVYQRRQDPRFLTKSVRTEITLFNRIHDPSDHLTEMYVMGDDYPYVDVTNPTAYTIRTARIVLYGFRYRVEWGETYLSPVDVPVNFTGIVGEGF